MCVENVCEIHLIYITRVQKSSHRRMQTRAAKNWGKLSIELQKFVNSQQSCNPKTPLGVFALLYKFTLRRTTKLGRNFNLLLLSLVVEDEKFFPIIPEVSVSSQPYYTAMMIMIICFKLSFSVFFF